MTDKKQQDGNVTLGMAHANDNDAGDASTYRNKVTHRKKGEGSEANVTKHSKPEITITFNDWPNTLPVLPEEVALIEAYMPDLISTIIANDN